MDLQTIKINKLNSNIKAFLCIATLVLFSRFLIVIFSYLAIYLEGGGEVGGLWTVFSNIFRNSGDSVHYLRIAEEGYASSGEFAKYIVFYPLLPFCIWLLHFIVQDYFVAGIIISNLCLIVACYYLYRLVCIDEEEITAERSVTYFLLYPFSVFLIGVFTESMSIMLTAMVFYYMIKKKWLLVGILGFFASLTRFHGVLLIIPVIYEYLLHNRVLDGIKLTKEKIKENFKRIQPQGLYILLMPLGFGVYLLINKLVQGDWLIFYKHISSPPWWQGKAWIGDNLLQHFNMAKEHFFLGLIIYSVQIVLFFAVIGLFFLGIRKKIRTSYMLYLLVYLMFTYTSSWMISGPRYVMGDLPIYIVLAVAAKNKYARAAIFLLLTLFMVLYTIAFMQGQSIM